MTHDEHKAMYAKRMLLDAINLLRAEGVTPSQIGAGIALVLSEVSASETVLQELATTAIKHRERNHR